jgi:hypothetical protein
MLKGGLDDWLKIRSPRCNTEMDASSLANSKRPTQVNQVAQQHFSSSTMTSQKGSTSGRLSSLMSGHTYTYGRPPPYEFPARNQDQWATFFMELTETQCNWPIGMLQGVRGRHVNNVMAGVFLDPLSSPRGQAPGITVIEGPEPAANRDTTTGMGISEFTHHLLEIEDPFLRQMMLLTGGNGEQPLVLNWLKAAIDLQEEWLLAMVDIDSVSLTVLNPQFTAPAVIHAYPARAATLSTDNGLRVLHKGQLRPLSHCK